MDDSLLGTFHRPPVLFCNPPPTTVQGSKSVKILIYMYIHVHVLPKVYMYLLHLKVKHCQTLRVVCTFTGQNE